MPSVVEAETKNGKLAKTNKKIKRNFFKLMEKETDI